ncbi:MAG TPA: MarR family transcriptional regulator [Caldilineaceae bacterium]|nr:MarR family transcriptional regulator [Caldilineaceae bacterium]
MSTQSNDDRLIGALLRIPFQATVERVRKHLAGAGFTDLTMAHYSVFQHLRPEGSRVSELAAQAQITKQSMGALVEHLERCGYVVRRPDPSDGRAALVQLTARGEALVQVARKAVQSIEMEWEAYLGSTRMEELRQTLRDLITYIEMHKHR